MLRDDAEARRQRIEALERDLAAATRELEELRPRAERASRLEEERASLRRELERLRAAWAPIGAGRRRIAVITASVAVVAIAITGAYASSEIARARRETALARRNAEHALDDLRQRCAAEHREHSARTSEIVDRALHAVSPPFEPLTLESRRVTVRGRRDVARRCTVSISPRGRWISTRDGACRARVVCGDREIYPAPGHDGAFACEVREGRVRFGADVDGSAVDGDPQLMVHGDDGVITVSDGPEPAWSVAIVAAPF